MSPRLIKSVLMHLVYLAVLILLYQFSLVNFVLFHSTVEFIMITIAIGMFMVVWNARKILNNDFFLLISIVYTSVAVFKFFHIISTPSMGILTGYGGTLPTQIWIAERLTFSISLCFAFLHLDRKLNLPLALISYVFFTVGLLVSIFIWKIFPLTYITGLGLTDFKVRSEYVITVLLITSIILLITYRRRFNQGVFYCLLASLMLNTVVELIYTIFFTQYQLVNTAAHLLLLFSFFFMYRAVVEIGLSKPYNLLYYETYRLSQRKDELLSITGHEIKNPLTNIKLYTQLVAKQVSDPAKAAKNVETLQLIQTQADKIHRIINDLGVIGKIEAGLFRIRPIRLELSEYIDQTVTEFNRIAKPKVKFHKTAPVHIIADPERIRQVVINLLTNALKYSPNGKSSCVNLKTKGRRVIVSVTDYGVGIPADKIPVIFDKFFRVSDNRGGLGLGLYIAKEIIKQHHGKIWVTSREGQGSTFYFSLPIA